MATKLYFHNATSTLSGTLPSATQSSTNPVNQQGDSFSINRTMDTNVGTSETTINVPFISSLTTNYAYITKFVSLPLDSSSTSISANTWTFSGGYGGQTSAADFWPTNGASGGASKLPATLYVWRPSGGGSVVGTIFDGLSASSTAYKRDSTEIGIVVTFTGSAVTAATGDVLVYEAWGRSANKSDNEPHYFYFDGTTTSITDNGALSSAASSISTPQTLTFTTPPASVTCTVTGKTVTNKIITKA